MLVRIAATVTAVILPSISTLFLKQHSIIDVVAAVPICLIAYVICYGRVKVKSEKTADAVS